MTVGAFLGIFALMILLELPDKTMIATIVMSTRARPGSIVLGASAAFVTQMGLAVAAGGLLTLLPWRVKDVVVALLFCGGAAYLLLVSEESEEAAGEREAAAERAGARWREVATAFTVIFVAEFGDLTQVQAISLSAKTHQPFEVFLASSLAMISISFLGAFGGRMLQRVVPLKAVRVTGGLVFLGLGIATVVQVATG
ncbi:MAG: TMEM165/GDT1 family protein [Acidimicrobiales bacterium]